jgi:hypothetical protein
MRRLMSLTLAAGLCAVGFVGCSEKSSVTTEKKIETPSGETKITTEKTVEKSGDAPPPATNP